MHKNRKETLITLRRYLIILLLCLIAVSSSAKASVNVPANDDHRQRSIVLAPASRFNPSFALADLRSRSIRPASMIADKQVIREFNRAWQLAHDGLGNQEGVVLIFRSESGRYSAESPGFSNGYKRATFPWNPAALAIIHTHPNSCDPRPSEQDRRVADKYGVPIFTLTISGMYMYDPLTHKTHKVLNGLDWLDPTNLSRWANRLSSHLELEK
jgi:proteasome lid subunit RPN8/RPN11